MPVFIDYTKDILYKQGKEVGMQNGYERGFAIGFERGFVIGFEKGMEMKTTNIACKMFENGLDISIVQNVTGLNRSRLEEIAASVFKD